MSSIPTHPGVLLDRDGVLLVNRESHVLAEGDIAFLPGVLDALARLQPLTVKVAIVTNQSAVGRGLITLPQAVAINEVVVRQIASAGGRIDGVFMCPHHPDEGCACRKPRPGLLVQAAEGLGLDLHRSTLVGDTWNDIRAAEAAGVGQAILVRTGLGDGQAGAPPPGGVPNLVAICRDLPEALDYIRLRF